MTHTPLTDVEIEQGLQAAEKATPAPWEYSDIESVAGGSIYNVNASEPGGGVLAGGGQAVA